VGRRAGGTGRGRALPRPSDLTAARPPGGTGGRTPAGADPPRKNGRSKHTAASSAQPALEYRGAMRACGRCASATHRDKMVVSGQTLMAVTAQLPWAAHPIDRPSHVHDRAAGSRAATAYGSQLAASLAGLGLERHFGRGGGDRRARHCHLVELAGRRCAGRGLQPLRYALEMAGAPLARVSQAWM
jgi:hypothetical protein